MAAPKEIVDLVERFENNLESYKSGHYNETQVRREFVDPFFKALGWDIDNEEGFAEAYKDVIHEDAIRIGSTTKAPDYSFRIGGQRKFFLETKKPSVDIKDDIHPAFQLRRYAWTAKLPLSILTDFEELSVYDCRVKPDKSDKASQARVIYLTYQDYLNKWDEIAGIFSKNAVLKGSFDKYAADKKNKRGTTEVDAAFLEEIAGWREILARIIALRNLDLSTKDLNYAVQAIVDRIVFLRICEDRGIERSMRLQDLLNGERVYPRLCEFFRRADERYNSGIFHFEKEPGRESPDTLTLSLNIDDKPLKEIIKRLYYPDSPYEFSVLPAEILGQVYEQFLGKVIRLTEGHHAVVEDKPEVKKAGGVKYTPVYIVEAIVKKTLGSTLKGKTPLSVVLITVLDPACGSGSFLIVTYQYLLDWHRDWYVQNLVPLLQSGLKPSSPEIRRLLPGVETGKKGRKKEIELPIFQGRGGEWRLTTAERKRILLNNIYGVDIDRQAVEVTKLSLLLKVLEGENDETISKQLKLFQERALPDLSNNIKCGNSLIGWDILKDNPGLTQQEIDRINPFDWEKEFPDVFLRGGFNVIIGNPPYLYSAGQVNLEYFTKKYKLAQYQTDFYVYFIERSLSLSNSGSMFSFIVPDSWLNSEYFSKVRNHLLEKHNIKSIAIFDYPVFDKVAIENSIFMVEVSSPPGLISIDRFLTPEIHETINEIDPKQCIAEGLINPRKNSRFDKIIKKMESGSKPLSQDLKINRGIHAYRTDGYGQSKFGPGPQTLKDKEVCSYHADRPLDDTYLLEIKGKHVDRFAFRSSDIYISYGPWLAEPRTPEFFFKPKLAIRKIIGIKLHGMLFEDAIALDQSLYIIISEKDNIDELKHILGILLSRICSWYLENKYSIHDKLYPWFTKKQLAAFPMKKKDPRMISLVDSMLSLHKQLQEARTPHEQTSLQRQIEATDGQIDALVYELYGLTEEEIEIVEGKCV